MRRAHASGYTLVELVAVVVILGVLAAVVHPRFFERRTYDERGFYDEVVSAARYAQKFAFTTGCDVQFSVNAGTYALNQRATSCTTGAFTRGVLHPGRKGVVVTGAAPDGVAPFSMSPDFVQFAPSGGTADGVTRSVTVGPRTFQIVGATGFVQTQ